MARKRQGKRGDIARGAISHSLFLLTDFGHEDIYVGVMKGVIRGFAPTVTIDDLTHAIPAQDVAAAAFELFRAFPWLPAGSLTVAVVDPGVGSDRRLALVRAIDVDGQARWFLAPDNGLLARAFGLLTVLGGNPPCGVGWPALRRVEYLTMRDADAAAQLPPRFALRGSAGRTFDGRDRFAPLAARLATEPLLRVLPQAVKSSWQPLAADTAGLSPVRRGTRLVGRMVHIDRFGNAITNLRAADCSAAGRAAPRVRWRNRWFPLVASYSDAGARRDPVALVGSSGLIELAVYGGSFAAWAGQRLEGARGREVLVERQPD